MPRRLIAALCSLIVALLTAACEPDARALPTTPNVILIGLDTVRADHLGVYGNASIETPAINAFAAESAVFERASSAAPWTLPSFASIFTGLLPSEHGAIGALHNQLAPEHTTLAEILQRQGFSTRAFVGVDLLTSEFGLDQGFDEVTAHVGGSVSGRSKEYEQQIFRFLSSPPDEPYLLFAHYFDAHDPYDPPEPYDRMYYSGDPRRPDENSMAVLYGPSNRIQSRPEERYRWLEGITDIDYPISQYAAGISHIDHLVGRLLEKLRETGELERSIVTLVSDHGEHLTEHDIYFSHRFPYEETLHVPLIVRLPEPIRRELDKKVPRGRRIAEEVSTIDILPTLLELLGVPAPTSVAGQSLVPLLSGQPPSAPPRLLIAEFGVPNAAHGVYAGSVWDERFRYIQFTANGNTHAELYDHDRDPAEERDVIGEHPRTAERLRSALDAHLSLIAEPGEGRAPRDPINAETLGRLQALGYGDLIQETEAD